MLLDFEPIAAVRAFMERGGDVLILIAAVTFLMWTLMLERLWYFKVLQPREARRVEEVWRARSDHESWFADQVRRLLVSEVRLELHHSVDAIKTLVALCPLLGLLGTVTGMIRTFQAITLFGTGDPKMMASGISEALVTTMLGLYVAIPLVLLHALVSNTSKGVVEVLEEQAAVLIARRAEQRDAA